MFSSGDCFRLSLQLRSGRKKSSRLSYLRHRVILKSQSPTVFFYMQGRPEAGLCLYHFPNLVLKICISGFFGTKNLNWLTSCFLMNMMNLNLHMKWLLLQKRVQFSNSLLLLALSLFQLLTITQLYSIYTICFKTLTQNTTLVKELMVGSNKNCSFQRSLSTKMEALVRF